MVPRLIGCIWSLLHLVVSGSLTLSWLAILWVVYLVIWFLIRSIFGCQVIAGLWVLSTVGTWCNFLTLFYICKDNKTCVYSYVFYNQFHMICLILIILIWNQLLFCCTLCLFCMRSLRTRLTHLLRRQWLRLKSSI